LLELSPNVSAQDDLLDFIKNYIDEHFTQNIKIEDLSAKIFYSPDYFCKLFKEKFGTTPKAYILDKRIHFAKKLIYETQLSLTRISELCGFSDYVQFNKFYKKKENISPSQARARKE
jgi:AraC-like DNA-binding protein